MKQLIGSFVIVALVSVLTLGSAPALSQDTGFYVGASFGQTKVKDFDCSGTTSCDDKDTGMSIFGGYQFNNNFAVEAGYTDLGKASQSAGALSASFESSGIEISAVGIFPINPQWSVYGKLGMFMWDLDVKTNFSGNLSEDGTDLTYGIGVRWSFAKNLAVQLQWQTYKDIGDDATTGKSDVDMLSVGLLFRF